MPSNFGVVLFPAFEALDVFGPLETLNSLSRFYTINLTIIAETLDPVSTQTRNAAMNPYNSTFSESIVPTHTFETAPPLDVLLVPGGAGTRAPDINSTIEFVRTRYPTLKYLITVCTGAGLAARAGVLDGKNATTNKLAWAQTTALGPKVNWISHARWVQDGNIWTTSGVSAGTDGVFGWIEAIYGNDTASTVSRDIEYVRWLNPDYDPFADSYNLTDIAPQ